MIKLFKTSVIILVFTSLLALAQNTNDIMSKVKSNNLMNTIVEFSGEVEVEGIGLILDRSNEEGKNKARKYLISKFREIGVNIKKDYFNKFSMDGINLVATQEGIIHPDSLVIICAHYDSVDEYCADDNASGVAAVIEVARIFSNYNFKKTIVYAFWDLEEEGLYGSSDYAENAFLNYENISAVINSDMIGYDGNSDLLFELHTKNDFKNDIVYQTTDKVLNNSNLSLKPEYISFGTNRSDHGSFWSYQYPGVLFTQGFETNDFNPNYHTKFDRVEGISENYLTQITKLIAGVSSEIAVFEKTSSVNYISEMRTLLYNSHSKSIILSVGLKQFNDRIQIFDITGKEINSHLYNVLETEVNVSKLKTGVYFIKTYNNKNKIYKFIKY